MLNSISFVPFDSKELLKPGNIVFYNEKQDNINNCHHTCVKIKDREFLIVVFAKFTFAEVCLSACGKSVI